MSTAIIIIICLLLLLAYLFDITASKTRIPTVILLLALGWTLQQLTGFLGFSVPDLKPLLPAIGTIGLILIVLDGTLELELRRGKLGMIRKSAFTALAPMILMSLMLAVALHLYNGYSILDGLLNSIPLAVISSSIAIPSARHLSKKFREFVVYESSLSDILGILFYNFFALNQVITGNSFVTFFFQMTIMFVISILATFALAWLLSHTTQNIKFIPIILIIILIYSFAKLAHLPSLLLIMVLGLFLGNLLVIPKKLVISYLKPASLSKEVDRFKELTAEVTFLIRSIFFILFGFLMETGELIDVRSLPWSISIVALIFITRALQLRISGLPLNPLLFIAPRGLITILLFLSIPVTRAIPEINSSVIIQVIVLSSVIIALGAFATEEKKDESTNVVPTVTSPDHDT